MIDYNFDKYCCGCAVCVDICPKKCIELVENKYGNKIPKVNKSICIDCHLCEKTCPTLNPARSKNYEYQMFSAKNNDEEQRRAGSSGSVFYLLAEYIIGEKGIVYGAAFDDNLKLRHISAERIEQLPPLLKSKYLQSDTIGIYNKVRKQLKDGQKVLFVGTPCQCNALYNYLGKEKPNNLYMTDFICHGVPSQKLFDDAKTFWEHKHKSNIVEFEFRNKRPDSVHSFYMKAKKHDTGEVVFIHEKYDKYPFYNGFKRYICFRESCYHCNFAVQQRVSDLTLADFWNIEKVDSTVDMKEFNKGYSMIVINSEQGKQLFSQIILKAKVKEFDIKYAKIHNSSYINHVVDSWGSKAFRFFYKNTCYPLVEFLFFTRVYQYINRISNLIFRKCL